MLEKKAELTKESVCLVFYTLKENPKQIKVKEKVLALLYIIYCYGEI